MARDQIGDRFEKRRDKRKLSDMAQRALSTEETEAEEQAIAAAKAEREKDPDKYRLKADAQVGRNDPCPCGSGKKFKKCCGAAK
ncbi:unnamed protein product [marine sediment metagenome]|uniref:Uncharacterized protein n=1 Tax=marine sediment metagenome TaxID=412755 RepID=X0S249_9ZZZZ